MFRKHLQIRKEIVLSIRNSTTYHTKWNTFLRIFAFIQIVKNHKEFINDSPTFFGSLVAKYIAASRITTIAHTIEHLLVHFDLYSNTALLRLSLESFLQPTQPIFNYIYISIFHDIRIYILIHNIHISGHLTS